MKKFQKVIIILLLLLLLSSCLMQNEQDSETTITPEFLSEKYLEEIEIFFPISTYNTPPIEFVWEWQRYIQAKYDIDITLAYIKENTSYDVSKGFADSPGVDFNVLNSHTTNGGIIYAKNHDYISDYIDKGLIVPVNKYIEQITSIGSIDSLAVQQFSDQDGNIWAIPLNYSMYSSFRLYNADWINKWGSGVPKTIDEFFKYAHYVRDNDPDSNNMRDSYIQMFNDASILSEFIDVFRAFGCYSNDIYPIGYNPLKKEFENILLNENFTEAITFIKYLFEEELIVRTNFSVGNRQEETIKVASTHMHSQESLDSDNDQIAGYYLLGINSEKLIKFSSTDSCFLILADTEDVAWKMECLFSLFKNNQDAFMDFYCGIKGKSYEDCGDYYTYTFNSGENEIDTIMIYTNIDSDNYEIKPRIYYTSDININIQEEINKFNEWEKARRNNQEYYNSDLSYSVSHLIYNEKLVNLNERIYKETIDTLSGIINNEVSVIDALSDYRTKLELNGVLEQINDINNN